MDLKLRFLNGMIAGGSGVLVKAGLGILILPIMIAKLGAQSFGFYAVLLSISEILLTFDLGLTTGLIHRLSGLVTQDKPAEVRAYLTIGHLLYGLVGLLMVVAGLFANAPIVDLLNLSSDFKSIAQFCVMVAFWDAAINLYGYYYRSVLMSHSLYQWTNSADILQGILNSLFCAALLLLGHGLKSLIVARLCVSAVMVLFLVIQANRTQPGSLWPMYGFRLADFKALAQVSVYFMIQRVCNILTFRMDNLILGMRMSMIHVAAYSFVTRIFGQVPYLITKLSEGLLPFFLKIDSVDEAAQSRFLFLRMSSFINFLTLAMLVTLCFNYPFIYSVLSKGRLSYEQTAMPILPLCLLLWSSAMVVPATNFLYARSEFQVQVNLSVMAALLNFGLSWYLVGIFGISGVVIGAFIPHVIEHQFLLIPKARKALSIGLAEYLKTAYILNIPAILAMTLTFWAFQQSLASQYNSFWYAIPISGAAFLLGSYIWFQTAASDRERAFILVYLEKRHHLSLRA